ncbi:argonaute 1 isoform B [Micractinium conductrix]|uniref:Argonaute 1 isoform A n=1 Tax=Micractinium conductrix TaxID=554055 RepID=A0A2P6VAF4_9CHLO|nr:argonaute 1 isoform A [Micractinium conductrix]PSC71067.1 argonaute 1 isoform B [Micractinium conductrix]|eukprot:PSC71066.1 argonaute 1 isoform A [Micractinium conductrix]
MPAGQGFRARTRHTFQRAYRQKGYINLSTYLTNYKLGDYVDVKVNGAVHKGMPHKYYHGKTGRVWNVTKRAVGVEMLKQVNGRYIKKRIHVRIEHVQPSRCHEEFLRRCKENDAARHEAKVNGTPLPTLKRQPKGPRTEGIMLENVTMESITAVPYDILKEGVLVVLCGGGWLATSGSGGDRKVMTAFDALMEAYPSSHASQWCKAQPRRTKTRPRGHGSCVRDQQPEAALATWLGVERAAVEAAVVRRSVTSLAWPLSRAEAVVVAGRHRPPATRAAAAVDGVAAATGGRRPAAAVDAVAAVMEDHKVVAAVDAMAAAMEGHRAAAAVDAVAAVTEGHRVAGAAGRLAVVTEDVEAARAPPPAPRALVGEAELGAEHAPLQLAFTPQRTVRPGHGSAGRPVKVIANWFKVECSLNEAYHYDVDVRGVRAEGAPEQPPPVDTREAQRPMPAEICRAAMKQLSEELQWPAGAWAFDGRKNMYAPFAQLVPKNEIQHEVSVDLEGEGRPRRLLVVIRRVAIIPISSLKSFMAGQDEELAYHAIQALDIVLKHRVSYNKDCLPVGRGFFFHDQNVRSIGGGAEVWLGYQQSLRPCQTGLALNIDMAATAMLEMGELTDYMHEKIGDVRGSLTPVQQRILTRALKGIKVMAKHNQFKKAIRSVCRGSPFEEKFLNEAAGREMTVAEYFKQQYNISLTNKSLPCIAVGNGKVILPPELCTIAAGQRRAKLTETQTAEMIKTAAQRPDEKARWIDSVVQQKAGWGTDPGVRAFGMRVDGKQMQVQARVLPNPRLSYGFPRDFDPKGFGAWNLRDVKFLTGSSLASWAIACFANPRFAEADLTSDRTQNGASFIKDFIDMLNACGVVTPSAPYPPCVFGQRGAAPAQVMRQAADQARSAFGKPCQLILVVLPDTGQQLYKDVKQAGDSMLGIPSQCVVAKKAGIGFPARGRPQYCANVAMKVNAKLDGCNVRLADAMPTLAPPIGSRPFMIFGADVTHPMGGEGMPSIAAVVGSMDASATRYAARVSMQTGRQVIIVDLKGMMKSLLSEFHRVTRGRKPEHLIFFRDGVSEGQFKEVYFTEYSAVREACKEMGDPDSDYAPPITFVVVQKRHHTRFFPLPQDQQNRDRSGNILPGTVVDSTITHPFEFDFYLNSHAGIQGTSRPTKYHVLVDENKFGADALQGLTYKLCYLFCRCTRSISVVPAAQYAHLAAFRGRVLCRGGDSETGSVSSGGGSNVEFLPVHPNLAKPMFYA